MLFENTSAIENSTIGWDNILKLQELVEYLKAQYKQIDLDPEDANVTIMQIKAEMENTTNRIVDSVKGTKAV